VDKVPSAVESLVALTGKMYVTNHILHVEGYPATASLAIYNLMGQKIVAYTTINGNRKINLPTKGVYLVTVTDKGEFSSKKIIVQ
jgi:hypothetical protein